MKFTIQTYEILAWKLSKKSVDEVWSNWATEMLMNGFATEHLIELVGLEKPYNQFELSELTDKVFEELKIDLTAKNQIIKNYVFFLCQEVLSKKRDLFKTLHKIKTLYLDLDFENLIKFYFLSFAKEDLINLEIQHYWDGANRENIDQICFDYFKKWMLENPLKEL
jgi:hypothetical protein